MTSKATSLGHRLRGARRASGLSIAAVSARSGVSTGLISLVENDRCDISVGKLSKLLDVYGVTFAQFLRKTQFLPKNGARSVNTGAQPESPSKSHANNGWDFTSRSEGVSFQVGTEARLTPILVSMDVGGRWQAGSQHDSEELLFVLEGQIEVRAGDQQYKISPFQGIYLPSRVTHSLCNAGSTRAMLLSVLTEGGGSDRSEMKKVNLTTPVLFDASSFGSSETDTKKRL
jgi:transcriptional regulator with XRE-family HTH domain